MPRTLDSFAWDGGEDEESDEGSYSGEQGCDEGADEYADFDFLEGAWGFWDPTFEPENRQKALKILGRLREGWTTKQVVKEELHEKACCMCHKNNWRNSEWYIMNGRQPKRTDKVCLECGETWLARRGWGDAAMPRATEGSPLLGNVGNNDTEGDGALGGRHREAAQAGGAGQAAAVATQANGAKVVHAPAQGDDGTRTPALVERVPGRSTVHTPVVEKEDPDTVLTPVVKAEDPDTQRFLGTGVLTPPHPVRGKSPERLPRALGVKPRRAVAAAGNNGGYKAEHLQIVADIKRRLPPGYGILPVKGVHKRECSECKETSWEHGDPYIFFNHKAKPIAPYVYEKVCVACFEKWLMRKKGGPKAAAAPPRWSTGSAAGIPQLSSRLEGDGAGPASPHQPSKEGKGRMADHEQLVKRSRLE